MTGVPSMTDRAAGAVVRAVRGRYELLEERLVLLGDELIDNENAALDLRRRIGELEPEAAELRAFLNAARILDE